MKKLARVGKRKTARIQRFAATLEYRGVIDVTHG